MNEEVYQYPSFSPMSAAEKENKIISFSVYGRKAFAALVSNKIMDLNFYGDPHQCFPFYTYSEDGTNRQENITDWALEHFRAHYGEPSIGKWDIFHYVYGLLHHPDYRTRYAANLRRELPRLPLCPGFWDFTHCGSRLAELHVGYEDQAEYKLEWEENPKRELSFRVEKMRLSKDKTKLAYNEFLTLSGIPAECFEYKLGNRSALEWVIDQYRVTTDERSGITNDPNREDDERYIVRLIGKVITVSLQTVRVVKMLPPLPPI